MKCFHDFTAPLWELFAGNLLFFLCSLFYLFWWGRSFKPGSTGGTAAMISIGLAFVTGLSAFFLLCAGIGALSQTSHAAPVKFIFLIAAALYFVLLFVTAAFFKRPVTSELLIILLWASLELAAVTVLFGTGRFGCRRAAVLAALIGTASLIGMVCYVLYYRLGATASYRDGMIPLISDAVVMAVFSAALAVS